MRNFLFTILFLFFTSSAFALDENSVVKIEVNGIDIATGFVISTDGEIVTAYHAICGRKNRITNEIVIYVGDKQYKNPIIKCYDELSDVAVLKINAHTSPLVKANDSEIRALLKTIGGHGLAYGYPDGKPLYNVDIHINRNKLVKCSDYIFPQYSRYFSLDAKDVLLIPFNGAISPGMSGGPIMIGDKVVGVISGTQASQGDTFGWGIPMSVIDKLTIKNVSKYSKLPSLKLIDDKNILRFVKSGVFIDFNDYKNVEIVVISAGSWLHNISDNQILRKYIDQGVKVRQIYLSNDWDKSVLQDQYTEARRRAENAGKSWKQNADFWFYLTHKNQYSFTDEDVKIINKYNINQSPTIIGYYKGEEISRYTNSTNVLQYVYYNTAEKYKNEPEIKKMYGQEFLGLKGSNVDVFDEFVWSIISYATNSRGNLEE